MLKKDLSVAEIADKFDDFYFQSVFLEAAIRGLVQTGNIDELHVGEGLAVLLRSLYKENRDFQHLILERINCLETAIQDESMDFTTLNDGKKET